MTSEERAELVRLEAKLQFWLLKLHQSRLLCSGLRREIRLATVIMKQGTFDKRRIRAITSLPTTYLTQ